MVRERPRLGTPFTADGPVLSALLDVIGDMYDLLDARLPQSEGVGGPVKVAEPAPVPEPESAPAEVVPVSEPAPDLPPDPPAAPEPEPDVEAAPAEDDEEEDAGLPEPPPRAGRGSSLKAWLAFAELAAVYVPDDASRDDVVAACETAGVLPRE